MREKSVSHTNVPWYASTCLVERTIEGHSENQKRTKERLLAAKFDPVLGTILKLDQEKRKRYREGTDPNLH